MDYDDGCFELLATLPCRLPDGTAGQLLDVKKWRRDVARGLVEHQMEGITVRRWYPMADLQVDVPQDGAR